MEELINIDDECVRCGICEKQQAAEGMPVIMCGDLARELAEATDITEVSPEAYDFVLSCSLCDACTANCPRLISCAALVRAGREQLIEFEPEFALDYRAYRTDYRENLFAAVRDAAGFVYEDALDEPVQGANAFESQINGAGGMSLFFPGCSLSSYSESLTKATFARLQEEGLVQGMSVYCCGKPIGDSGAKQAYQSYSDSFIEHLRRNHVSRLIVACPNCFYALASLFLRKGVKDVTLDALPEVLVDLGLSCNTSDFDSITVHDSCPDRFSLRFAQATRALLKPGGVEIREMQSSGTNTICCGAGGFSQIGGPTHSEERCTRRLRQFEQTGADCLICSCMSCVSTFLSGGRAPKTKHYLERVFGIAIDWHAAELAFDKMSLKSEALLGLPLHESTRVFDA